MAIIIGKYNIVPISQAPTVVTNVITSFGAEFIEGGGYVVNDNGSPVTARGVCWSTSPNPTIANSITKIGRAHV